MIECRQYPRVPVDLQVYFSTTGNTSIREGTMFDLSAGGCAVTSMTSMQAGSAEAQEVISLPEAVRRLAAEATPPDLLPTDA